MKYILAILKTPPPRCENDPRCDEPYQQAPLFEAFGVIAWDEVNDVIVEKLGWFELNAANYARLQDPNDPATKASALAEFKDEACYKKGRKLYGHHAGLDRYQKLVQRFDLPALSKAEKAQIRKEYAELRAYNHQTLKESKLAVKSQRFQFISNVDDLAADWGISTRKLYEIVGEIQAENKRLGGLSALFGGGMKAFISAGFRPLSKVVSRIPGTRVLHPGLTIISQTHEDTRLSRRAMQG